MAIAKAEMLLDKERKRKILQLLETEGRVTVPDLAKRFRVSAVTVRSDLEALAAIGALIRARGGAIKLEDAVQDYPIHYKETLNHAEKTRIGQAAAKLICPGQTVILDSGTTTFEIARQIKGQSIRPLAVVTNALPIAFELCGLPQITVVMLGGLLREASYSLVGPQAEHALSQLNADQLFLGVAGLDPEIGLSTPDILEAQLNALMISVAQEVTLVSDSSKLGRRSLSVISKLERIQRLITDDRVNPPFVESLRNCGIEVVVV